MNRNVLLRMNRQHVLGFQLTSHHLGMTLSIGNDHNIDRFELCSYRLIRVEQ